MAESTVAVGSKELHRDITSSAGEFVRTLRLAFPDLHENHPASFRARSGEVTLEVDFSVGPPRRIALLVLPTLLVRLHLSGGAAAARAAMLEHLDRYLHRGGG